jgi:N-acetylmuramoyl-L-alanine amidase
MRVRPALAAAVLSLATATLAAAQARPPAWRLEGGRAPVEVPESDARGYPALPVSALVSVGAELSFAGDTAIARFGAAEARFVPGSADVLVAGRARTLAHAAYEDGGAVYVPAEFFAQYLAEASGGALQVAPSERLVRMAPDAPARRAAAPVPGPAADAAESADATPHALAHPAPDGRPMRRLVVVDAGHGGVDPGAHGPGGTREKDVTLRVARMVADLLRDDPSLEVHMTRTSDTLIGLYDRPRMANAWRKDGQPAVFLSIHCNANPSRDEKGYETYFLSEARTADAQRVERFENASAQYDDHAAAGDAMGFILTDLRQNHYLRESSEWAQMIQDELHRVHPGPDRGVKQAGFAVLRGSFMPAVLVEIGFVTNVREEQLLVDREMEASIARQLAEAVKAYFDRPTVRPAAD